MLDQWVLHLVSGIFSVNLAKIVLVDMSMCVSTVQARAKSATRSWGVAFFL